MMQRYLFLFILLSLRVASAYGAVEVHSSSFTTAQGIANNTVRQIYQDRRGYIWLGSLNGVSRYDGHTFINYFAGDGTAPALGGHRVASMVEDCRDRLWIATSNERVSCYDPRRDGFIDYTGMGEYQENYSHIERMSNGDIWLWHEQNGCRRLRPEGDSFASAVFTTARGNLPKGKILQLQEDCSGRIWLLMENQAYLIEKEKVVPVMEGRNLTMLSSAEATWLVSDNGCIYRETAGAMQQVGCVEAHEEQVSVTGSFLLGADLYLFTKKGGYVCQADSRSVYRATHLDIPGGEVQRDNRGNYWVYNHTGWVWRVEADSRKVTPLHLIPSEQMGYIDSERYHFLHDQRGIIWITTYGNGLFALDVATGELQHFRASADGTSAIPSDFLLHIAADRSGGIWVSAEYCGVSRLSVLSEGVSYLYPAGRSTTDDRSNHIRMLLSPGDDHIWVGTRKGGLFIYDKQLNLLRRESHQTNVYAVALDTLGHTWMGTRGDGLCVDGRWYRHQADDATSLSGDHIFALHADRKGRMWVGVFSGGLDLAVRQAGGGYTFRHFLDRQRSQLQVRAIVSDRRGHMWVGTSNGIYIFHPDSLLADADAFVELSAANGRFRCDEVKAFSEDAQGRMWIATSGAGLAMIDLSAGDYGDLTPRYYDTSCGLVNDMAQAVVCTPQGTVWVTTEYGVSCLNTCTNVFQNYLFSSSVLDNSYADNCACLLPDGRLLLGSSEGLLVAQPDIVHLRWPAQTPSVMLTSLRINGILQHPGSADSPLQEAIAYTKRLELPYMQNSIEFGFTIFDYSREGTVRYSHKLDRYDTDWSQPSTRPYAAYKNLPPGDYVLHVKACTSGGQWSREETALRIRVNPPFWQTGWAILIYMLLGAVLTYFLCRMLAKVNALRNRIEVERQLTEYKLMFFTNISHEFRTPLSLIQNALEKLHQHPENLTYTLQVLDKSTQRMLRLINQLLEFRKMQKNKLALSLEQTDVVAFLHDIFLSFQEAAESKQMDYRFECSLSSYQLFIDKGYLDKVTYNLLSNAFKYTPSKGQIVLSMDVDEAAGQWRMQVTDTGVGVPREQQGELFNRFMQSSFSGSSMGVGLHLSHELVSVHHGTLTYAEHRGGGSVFTVTLPTDASVYEAKDFLVPNVLMEEEGEHERQKQADEEKSQLPSEEEPVMSLPLNHRKVLIIEDDLDVREFLRREIGQYFEVEVEMDGKSGLEKALTYDADLIVCDVMMPGLNGFEVTRRLKSDFSTSHIPIILLTALDEEGKQLEGLQTGADAYITKPFSIKLLIARIVKLIEGRERLKEKYAGSTAEARPAICSSTQDREFADRLQAVMEHQIANTDFTIDEFASQMKLGRTMFYRKVRGVTGYSPNEYMRIVRMKRAAEYLSSGENLTVAEVSYRVGLNDPFYFSKCFKQQFGVSPSAYQKGERKQSPSSV